MKYLRIVLKSLELYFVFKDLKKRGFIKQDYSLIRIIKVYCKNKEFIDKQMKVIMEKEVNLNEEKQSESETV
ncbi:MAG: hypothetical protein HUJ87_15600 [Fusobacterium varium]|uniref:hypothetical protein n=1 Tax=Fusobacterium varium TaxID=856 RepID=UPI0024324377|nr:hypothetical protein [Fusobacterium varium]MCF0171915.1 hypothetical protein [Fusobacterium varium]